MANEGSGSRTPQHVRQQSHGRSRTRRGGEVVVREIVRESGSGGAVTYPTLTKTNYLEWAIIMRVKLQGAGLWEAVDTGGGGDRQERQALGAILCSVPPEMVPVLATKDNAKAAWDAIKVMWVGVDRVREARRQKLRKDFENIAFKSGEGTEEFALRLSSIVSELQALGDDMTELKAVQKYLRVVLARYAQMACSIETLLDLEHMSIEELSGRLAASDERGEPEVDAGGRLLLTEEEWRARSSTRGSGEGSVASSGKTRDKGKKPQGRPSGDGGGNKSDGGGKPPRRNGKCNYCGIEGYWACECRKAKRERGDQGKREEAHLSQGQEEESAALLLAVAGDVTPDAQVAPRAPTASAPDAQAT